MHALCGQNFYHHHFFLDLHLLNHSFSGSLAFIVRKQVVCILTSLVVNIITLLDITCSCYILNVKEMLTSLPISSALSHTSLQIYAGLRLACSPTPQMWP